MTLIKQFFDLSFPEKIWVLRHLFKAPKAFKISKTVESVVEKMQYDSMLDSRFDGGKLDAFHHCYWMALLTQKIGSARAISLGRAHEKANRRKSTKKIKEDGSLPDAIATEMDKRNNSRGVSLGRHHSNLTDNELINKVKEIVTAGELWILKIDKNNRFIDWKDEIIDINLYQNKWYNPKCIVPSNYNSFNY